MLESSKKHLKIYWLYFIQFWKSRLIYKTDFIMGLSSQAISLAASIAFLGLLFTQVDQINGWNFYHLLLLAGVSGFIMNLHHIFFFNLYTLGEDFIIQGKMDRLLVRPLNPLFQVYADAVSDDNVSKFIVNAFLIVYAASHIEMSLLTPINIIYGIFAVISGVMVFGSIYILFATTAFWTGRSRPAMWLIFRMSEFRKYPYGIYSTPIKILLITLIPIAFASFFPTTFFLQRSEWFHWQIASLFAGPIFYFIAYQFWKFGLSNYSSTGS